MKAVLAVLMLLFAAGIAQAGKVQTKTDDFDGTSHVWVDEYGLRCDGSLCFALGADWNSRRPDVVILVAKFMGAYTDVRAMALNIDGEFVPLPRPNGRTDYGQAFVQVPGFYVPGLAQSGRTSTRGFDIPREVFARMLGAKTVKVRLIIDEGNLDARLVDNGKPTTKALRNFQDFLAALPVGESVPQTKIETMPNDSTPAPQGGNWWQQQKPAQPAPARYRCTDADGKPYVTTTPTKGCVVE